MAVMSVPEESEVPTRELHSSDAHVTLCAAKGCSLQCTALCLLELQTLTAGAGASGVQVRLWRFLTLLSVVEVAENC